jgi:hypothetical protein
MYLRQHLPGDLLSMFSSVDGGRSWIFSSGTSQGGPSSMFFTLIVATPRSLPTPARGSAVDVS